MSLFSFFFPHRARVQENKQALKDKFRDELCLQIVDGLMKSKHANPNREGKYDLFVEKRITIIRKR